MSGMTTFDRDTRTALAAGALKAAAARNWRDVTLFDIADAAGRPISDFAPATTSDALDAIETGFDAAAALGLKSVDKTQKVRDRLFDILMRRFEAMEAHRLAVLSIDAAIAADPGAVAQLHLRHVRAARWALTLAGLEADGVTGAARAQGLAVMIGQARQAWRLDTDGDFAKTMASLDKNLRRAEETFGRFGGFEGKPAEQS
jgi:hypothetical protein